MQTKKSLAASSIALLTIATAAGADVQRVGVLGTGDKLVIKGAKAFSSDEIREAIFNELDVVATCDPDAPLTELTAAIARKTEAGYHLAGFCDVVVSVTPADGRLVMTIEEGERFTCGEIVISGHREIDAEKIKTELIQPTTTELKPRSHWRTEEPASFAPETADRLTQKALAAAHDQGHYSAKLKAKVRPDRRTRKATLRIDIIDEGPLSTLRDVEMSGNERDSRAAVIACLGFNPSAPLTRTLREQIERRLLASGRFTQVRWELGEPGERDASWRPRLALQEYELAPTINEPLSREEKALLRLAEWFHRLDTSQEEVVLQDNSGKNLMVFAPQRGFIVLLEGWNDDVAAGDRPDFNYAIVIDEQRVGLYSRAQRRKIVAEPPPSPVVGKAAMSLVGDAPDWASQGRIELGAGFSSETHRGYGRHVNVQFKLSAAAALSLRRKHKASCRWEGDVLCLEWDKCQLRANAFTGQLVEHVVKVDSLDDDHAEKSLRIVVRPGEFERRLRQIEKATADWPNVADRQRPLSCVAEFLCFEMGQFSAHMERYADNRHDDFFDPDSNPRDTELLEELRQDLAASLKEHYERERLGYQALGKAISLGMLEPFDQLLCAAVRPSEERFSIPMPSFDARAGSFDEFLSAARKLAPVFGVRVGNFLFPADGSLNAAWRRALLASAKNPTARSRFRSLPEGEGGPLGALTTAELLRISGRDFESKMYATNAWSNLGRSPTATRAGYVKECRELLSGEGFMSKCLLQVVATMRQLTPADAEAIVGLLLELGMLSETHVPAFELAALRASAENSPAQSATEALHALWRAGLLSEIQRHLKQLAGIPENPAGELNAVGDVGLPRAPVRGVDGDESQIEAELRRPRPFK